jgi:hypothetical protein
LRRCTEDVSRNSACGRAGRFWWWNLLTRRSCIQHADASDPMCRHSTSNPRGPISRIGAAPARQENSWGLNS